MEKGSDRRCFENDHFVAFTPYAPRFVYELWIFPKTHRKNITELNEDEYRDLADILLRVLQKLKQLGFDYNYYLHYSPQDDLHFHFEVTPRRGEWAGFELSGGIYILSVSPESAAKFYRQT